MPHRLSHHRSKQFLDHSYTFTINPFNSDSKNLQSCLLPSTRPLPYVLKQILYKRYQTD